MAEQPIHYSDLIAPDNSIENLIKQLEQLKQAYTDMQKTVAGSAIEIKAQMKGMSGATAEGRKATASATKEVDKLAQAQKALRDAESETAQQIALVKNATAEQTAVNKLNAKQAVAAADSYDGLSAQYSKNMMILNKLSAEERKNTEYGKALEKETLQIRQRMNELQKSVGNYTLQVGKYNIAANSMKGIIKEGKDELKRMADAGEQNTVAFRELAERIAQFEDQSKDVDAMVKQLASDTSALDSVLSAAGLATGGFAVVTGAMQMFGSESEDVEEAQKTLQSAIAMVNGVTAIQNALQKQSALMIGITKIQTMALSKAEMIETAIKNKSTKATKAATIAMKAFNAVAKSNPLMLIASAAILAAGAITTIIVLSDKEAKQQKKLYEQELKRLEVSEATRKLAIQNYESNVKASQHAIDMAEAEGKSKEEILELQEQQLGARAVLAAANTQWNKKEIDNYEQNKRVLGELYETQKKADEGSIDLSKKETEALEAHIALLERQIEIAEEQINENKALEISFAELAQLRRQLAIETAAADEESLRKLQDARFKLIKNQFARERAQTKANYERQKADLETELENNVNLTVTQRENMNALIVELEKQKQAELAKITENEMATNRAAYEATENMRLALMDAGTEKEMQQLMVNYERQRNALTDQLQKESELTIEQKEQLNEQLLLLEQQYNSDVDKLRTQQAENLLNAELNAIELKKAAAVKGETDLTADTMREIEIRRQLELSANAKLAKELRQDEKAINAKYDMERKKTEDELRANIANKQLEIQQNLAKSEIDIMQTSEKKKTTMRLQLEKERLQKVLELNEKANIKMSEEERKTIENQIKKIENDIKKNETPTNLYEVLGLNLTDEQIDGLNSAFDTAKTAINDFYKYKEEKAKQAVELATQEVDAAQEALNAEKQARAAGYANNVEMAEKELSLAKENQRKALKQQADAQRAQMAIDTAEQASNMITASSKVFKAFGFPYAIPVLALMWGAFAAAKIKAFQMTKETYGDGTVELLSGGSHQSGNDVDLGTKADGTKRRAEGGEFFAVINKRSSRKYRKEIPEIINSLNRGDFAQKYASAYDGGMNVIATFDGKAELTSIAKDMREMNEREKAAKVIYTTNGRIEKRGNVTRIINN